MRTPLSRMSRRGRVTIAVLAVVLLFFTVFEKIVDAWADLLWFREVDYSRVFLGVLWTRLALFALFGLVVGLLVAGNLYLAYRMRPLLRPHSPEQQALDRYRLVLLPRIGTWITLLAVVVGLFAGLSAQGRWQDWMLFTNSQPFGGNAKDPQFNIDASFYVFEYPFWRYLVAVGFTTVVLSLLGALALHYLFGGVRLQGAGDRMTTAARAHLTALVAAFVALKAVAYFLDRRGLVLNQNESVKLWGGGYTDINALLPAKEILAWISVVVAVAILVFSNAFMRNLLWPGVALGLLAISAVAIGGIYPAVVQSFTVKPSPLSKETPYIQRSIDATRQAYGLSDVRPDRYPGNQDTPPPGLATDKETISTIRLLDPHVVGPTYTQTQQVKGFYEFNEKLDIDRYEVQGQVQDFVVGVREINYKSQIVDTNWQNRHTIYTHGYGFVGAPANKVVCNGQPYFVSGFFGEQNTQQQQSSTGERCASSRDEIATTQPRIYYGEQMSQYAVVGKAGGDKDAEFDQPTGEAGAQYTTYAGSGGVPIGSYWRRLLYAAHFREANFLLSSVVNDNSKLMYVRNPAERVHKIAPFLTLDNDPYPAVVDGKIIWILDGYTTAATYPYSQVLDWRTAIRDTTTDVRPFAEARQDVNYVRNSVKATVDAYTGKVTLYAFDDTDPVLKAWNKAFGGKLVKSRSQISPKLQEHFRYPEDQFKVQRDLLSRFHVTDPKGFFSGDDFWQVPADPANQGAGINQPPYFLLARFPGQEKPTFQLTAPLNPRNRQNLAALVSGSYVNGRPHLQVLQLPTNTPILGPGQVWQNMTTSGAFTGDLTSFERQNTKPVHGNLLSLPVGDGMLYVEPLYIQNKEANPQPRVRKVLLTYGKYIAYQDTLEAGLADLVKQAGGQGQQTTPPAGTPNPGGQQGQPQPPANAAVAAAVANLNKAIDDLHNAQKGGNFEEYGRALKALEDAIKAYQDAQAAAAAAPATPTTPAPSTSASPSPGASPAAAAGG